MNISENESASNIELNSKNNNNNSNEKIEVSWKIIFIIWIQYSFFGFVVAQLIIFYDVLFIAKLKIDFKFLISGIYLSTLSYRLMKIGAKNQIKIF